MCVYIYIYNIYTYIQDIYMCVCVSVYNIYIHDKSQT